MLYKKVESKKEKYMCYRQRFEKSSDTDSRK